MKRFAFLSDIIFTFTVSGLFTLCLFRFLSLPLWLALLLALLCGLLTALAVGAWLQSKRKTAFLKKSDEALREKLFLHLALLGERGRTDFSAHLLPQDQEVIRRGKSRLLTSEHVYFLQFDFAPVTADDIAHFSRYKTQRKKHLFCARIHDDALALAKRLDIRVLCGNELFLTAKTAEALQTMNTRIFGGRNGCKRHKTTIKAMVCQKQLPTFFSQRGTHFARFRLYALCVLLSAFVRVSITCGNFYKNFRLRIINRPVPKTPCPSRR